MEEHRPTVQTRKLIRNMAIAGIPLYKMEVVAGMPQETILKHYRMELNGAEAETVAAVGHKVVEKALEGDIKAASFYLRTKGYKYGWQEKQVIEQVASEEFEALKNRVSEVEQKESKEY